MAVTYFGNNDAGSNSANAANYVWWYTAGYACPGTGLQDVVTLDLNTYLYDSGSGNMRCAIFTAAGAFVTQWATEVDVEPEWNEVTSFVDQGGSPHSPQLTGGDTYLLVVSGDGNHELYYDLVDSGNAEAIYDQDYTGGFPANLPASSNEVREICIRCGVQPAAAASGVSIPKVMYYYMGLRRK